MSAILQGTSLAMVPWLYMIHQFAHCTMFVIKLHSIDTSQVWVVWAVGSCVCVLRPPSPPLLLSTIERVPG